MYLLNSFPKYEIIYTIHYFDRIHIIHIKFTVAQLGPHNLIASIAYQNFVIIFLSYVKVEISFLLFLPHLNGSITPKAISLRYRNSYEQYFIEA